MLFILILQSHVTCSKLCNMLIYNTNNKKVIFFLIQFNVPFKIISLIETSQWVGGAKHEYPGKTPDTLASRTWLVCGVRTYIGHSGEMIE